MEPLKVGIIGFGTVGAGTYEVLSANRELIADRKENPRDPATDPTSALLAARYEGEPLPDELIALFAGGAADR